MTAFPVLTPTLRRALRWLAVLFALGASGFAVAAALMFFWVLPNIADHRDTVASLLTRALGQRVTLEAVSGRWQQARPEFQLRGVRIYDAAGRPALLLPTLQATFAWRSLLVLEPRFNSIDLTGLALDVRRARDGRFYVGGLPVNPADPQSGFASWVLKQGRVHVGGATLTWYDEVRGAPPLALRDVDFTLANVRRVHRLEARATPPASLARPVAITGEIRARDLDDLKTWDGQIDARVAGVAFPPLAAWLSLPYQPHAGWGALTVRFDIAAGALAGVGAAVDLRGVDAALGADLPPLRVAQVRGQASWKRSAQGQRVAFENLRVALPGRPLSEPFNVGLAWDGTDHELTARSLRLGAWQSVLPSLPLHDVLRARLQHLQPQGMLDSLRLRWTGKLPGLDNFSLDARFRGLGMTAADHHPGFANLSGHIEGDARAGRFEIDSQGLALDLPMLFREPQLGFDTLQARGGWKKTARGRLLILDDAAFANADAAGSARGEYELIHGEPGIIDLEAQLTRAEGPAVYRYLPKKIGDHTVAWVQRGIVAGRSDDVRFVLRGDLRQYPFETGDGEFRIEAHVQAGIIDYVTGWPRIEGVAGRLLFAGKRMEVTSTAARIFGVALDPVKVVIPDLIHHEEILQVDGQASGPARDFIHFANFSPLADRLRGITDALNASGPMRLALKLQVPLRHPDDTTVAGRLSFLDNALYPPALPRVDNVRGDLVFTHDSVDARGLGGQLLGGPLRVDVATRGGEVQILAAGRATAVGMVPWLGERWSGRLSGQTAWRGRIDLLPGGERIRVESDLVGLASSLPAPLMKSATQPLPLLLTSQPQGDGHLNEMRLGRIVSAAWRRIDTAGFERGEVRFGGQAALPAEPGLRVAGSGRALDLSGWLAMRTPGAGGALPLSSIELGFDALDMLGRRYQDVRLHGRMRNGLLRTQVSARDVSGTLTFRPASGQQGARLSAQFRQFTLPERLEGVGGTDEVMRVRVADFPLLDLTVEDFRLQDLPLGRLEAVAHPGPNGLVIDSLQLNHPDSVFRMSGLWREGGAGETRAELALSVIDAGKLLARFGFPDTLRRGSAEIQGNATWTGAPADFAFRTLSGQLDFKAKSGQFLKVDPGVGKLLGVLSLQSLQRRLNFDFRDIFNEGYAFDDIAATLRIARGVIYSDDFRMRGPAAKVNMSGVADLNQETVQLRLKVIPKLSEGVAVAGALLGGPIAGVGALAAQKLLRDPVEEAISQEFMVTGAWLTPDVKRLPKARPPAENPSETPGSQP